LTGGRLRFVATHPFAMKLRMDGAHGICGELRVGELGFEVSPV